MSKEISWHAYEAGKVLEDLGTSDQGLSRVEAKRRLFSGGPNVLPEGKEKGMVRTFFEQFKSPLIYVLMAAAVVVTILGEPTDGSIIFFVLLVNALVGAFQEGKARQTLRSLRQFTKGRAVVLRDGAEFEISDEEIVRGDIIMLRDGEKIPADARIVFSQSLKINESTLTGESEPVEKDAEPCDVGSSLPERKSMLYKGTLCVSGQAMAVVVAIGLNTYVGSISEKLLNIESEMPLKEKIRKLSKTIGLSVLAAIILIISAGLVKGIGFIEIFFVATAVAVSLVPEGLPVVITLILARGVYRMAKRNALVKNMQAVEALGQADVIAVDKTGTITKNELMVERVYVDGKDFKILGSGFAKEGSILLRDKAIDPANHGEILFAGKIASFCASASVEYLENGEVKVLGDPTEAALLVFGAKAGFNKNELESEEPKVFEIPFSFKYKFHTTLHGSESRYTLSVVGAPESVLSRISSVWGSSGEIAFGDEEKEKMLQKIKEYSSKGLRILAFAFYEGNESTVDVENLPKLSLGGLFAMADVLREEVAEAVAQVYENDIQPVMITGDYLGTAEAIARQANIFRDGDRIITGEDMAELSAQQLSLKLDRVSVFARVLPEHKYTIVEAYKLRGNTIGMTGDGVNDALSLQAAHLGIAMGQGGTEVAREAADMVLLDNNFRSIVAAIEEGRSIYATIKKVVLYLISTSLGEFLTIAGALFVGLPLPLFPSQILWLNLVTDGFMVVTLGFEPNVSLRDGERGTNIITKKTVVRSLLMGMTMMLGTLAIFSVAYGVGDPKAWTLSLTVLAVYQWFNAWNVRSEKKSAFHKPFSNRYLLLGLLGAASFHILAVYNPFMQKILRTVPLDLSDWALVISVAFSIVAVEEIRKILVRSKS